jgi:dipeptidyl aminopeptidase/acylaminoacyl peptidase
VGHGYLVFTPDIHFEVGAESGKTAGWWAYNAVESAAKYLSGLRYVDGRRMGLQGHSFGGFETNYIVTHSHRFAAAAEFSGMTNMISFSLSLALGTQKEEYADIEQSSVEGGQELFDGTLWQRRDLYEAESAVLWADRVSTPLLLVHNKKDGIVPWRQGVEWYLALRRLRKPSWMLQYDESYHSNADRDARDYTLRLTQFFGYYLKGEPPPRWMTEGIPARLKGIDSGLELDASGRRP